MRIIVTSNPPKPSSRAYPSSAIVVRRVGPAATTAEGIGSLADVGAWLVAEASAERDLTDLLVKFIGRLQSAGTLVDRLTLHIGTLHPQLAGYAWIWQADDGFCDEVRVPDATIASDAYQLSPLHRVFATGETIRRAPNTASAQAEFPVMAELASTGLSDYVALPLPGLDIRNVMTFATRVPGGFTDQEIESMVELLKLFALHALRHTMGKIAENALGAYLGAEAAEKVLNGAIKRGAGESIRAVVWTSDLRNFTNMSDSLAPPVMLALLNAYFEAMGGAVASHGGEILKFIGDGMLAVFPVVDGVDRAARQAVLAAKDALARLAAYNQAGLLPSSPESRPALKAGIALHEGEVFFGNIGAPGRLDFTVIGAAVNEVCRLEALTKMIGRELLLTEAVARHLPKDVEYLGQYQLRGVSARVSVYGVPLPLGTPAA